MPSSSSETSPPRTGLSRRPSGCTPTGKVGNGATTGVARPSLSQSVTRVSRNRCFTGSGPDGAEYALGVEEVVGEDRVIRPLLLGPATSSRVTIRTPLLPGVAVCCRIGLHKRISLLISAHRFGIGRSHLAGKDQEGDHPLPQAVHRALGLSGPLLPVPKPTPKGLSWWPERTKICGAIQSDLVSAPGCGPTL
jgi:hypothetical protein